VSPYKGPIPKVIPRKIFLDVVPSASEYVTRTMRGQPKRLSRDNLSRNGGNCVERLLYMF